MSSPPTDAASPPEIIADCTLGGTDEAPPVNGLKLTERKPLLPPLDGAACVGRGAAAGKENRRATMIDDEDG